MADRPTGRGRPARPAGQSPDGHAQPDLTESRKAELRAILEEAERRGREDPGRITVLVPSKKV